jgi:hypothetical protein
LASHVHQPFLRNFDHQTTLPGDQSPGYSQGIPPGWAKNQTIASPTFNHTRKELGRRLKIAHWEFVIGHQAFEVCVGGSFVA